jgi:hypothetical protein
MAKNKISEWSAIPANNTDVGGIDINEGCAPSGINNAIRDVMAQIKDMQTGADGDDFAVGGNLTVTGALIANGSAGTSGQVLSSRGAGLSPQYQTLNLTAAGISNTPAGNISATNVQGAINELDTEKQAALGFAPVQQGGGSGQGANKVYIGWGVAGDGVKVQVDSTDFGVLWTNGFNSAIGVGQTWQNVTGSRAYGTTYTNSTGKPIYVSVSGQSTSAAGGAIEFYISGVLVARQGAVQNASIASFHNITMIVPNGVTYSANAFPGGGGSGGSSLQQWYELR